MVRLALALLRRGHFVARDADPISYKHFKFGPVKWRDYKAPYVEPPYWYKWSVDQSPYSPVEQRRIRAREDIGWYKNNFDKMKITPPDKWIFKIGDNVQILEGKDKGKTGQVVRIIPQRNWIVVGGRNCKYTTQNREVNAQEEPLEHDQISLLDPVDQTPTDVIFRSDKNGNRVRVSLKSGHIIEDPPEVLHDYTPIKSYIEEDKDTRPDAAMARTFAPSMKSQEEELKSIYKIDDDNESRKFYWY